MIHIEHFFGNHSSNLLATAAQHLGQPKRAKDYFNQSLPEDPDRSQDEPVTPTPEG